MTNVSPVAATPATPVAIDYAKLSVAQLRAIGKQILAAKTVAIEVEKLNKPVKIRGTGVIGKITQIVFDDPTLTGDKLFAAVSKVTKTTSGVCDSARNDLLRNGRFLKGKSPAQLAAFFGKL